MESLVMDLENLFSNCKKIYTILVISITYYRIYMLNILFNYKIDVNYSILLKIQ